MDPLTALIGPVVGGALSFFGGQENRSSAQAINAANLQQQLNMAQGTYLPGLVHNAERAGLNPLAVLGQHAPAGGSAVPIGAGEGLEQAGAQLAKMDFHRDELDKAAVEKAKSEVDLLKGQLNQVMISTGVNKVALDRLLTNPRLLPEGVKEPATDTALGIPHIKWLEELGEKARGGKPWGSIWPSGNPFQGDVDTVNKFRDRMWWPF